VSRSRTRNCSIRLSRCSWWSPSPMTAARAGRASAADWSRGPAA
jgi:hypothetical protein